MYVAPSNPALEELLSAANNNMELVTRALEYAKRKPNKDQRNLKTVREFIERELSKQRQPEPAE